MYQLIVVTSSSCLSQRLGLSRLLDSASDRLLLSYPTHQPPLSSVLHVEQRGVHRPRRHTAEDCSTCCPSVCYRPVLQNLIVASFQLFFFGFPAVGLFADVFQVFLQYRQTDRQTPAHRSLALSTHCPPSDPGNSCSRKVPFESRTVLTSSGFPHSLETNSRIMPQLAT